MVKEDLTKINGIGETTASKLEDEGVTSVADLRQALVDLQPSAGHIYSSFQRSVIDDLNLPTIGADSVSKYHLLTNSHGNMVYRWDRDEESVFLKLTEDDGEYIATWETENGDVLQSRTHSERDKAIAALTRWAYRPLEVA